MLTINDLNKLRLQEPVPKISLTGPDKICNFRYFVLNEISKKFGNRHCKLSSSNSNSFP